VLTLFPEIVRETAEERAMIAPIEQLPRPRYVSVRTGDLVLQIVLYFIFVFVGISLFTSSWSADSSHPSLYERAFASICLIIMAFVVWANVSAFFRNRKLLANGEVALGRVFHVSRGRHPRIEFTFQDKSGRTIATLAAKPRRVCEGMAIIVFYDPSNPEKRCVPMCGSLWKIRSAASVMKNTA